MGILGDSWRGMGACSAGSLPALLSDAVGLFSINDLDCGLAQVYSLDKTSEYKHHFDTARLAVPYFVKDAQSFERQYPAAGRDRCAWPSNLLPSHKGEIRFPKEQPPLRLFTDDSPRQCSCLRVTLPATAVMSHVWQLLLRKDRKSC